MMTRTQDSIDAELRMRMRARSAADRSDWQNARSRAIELLATDESQTNSAPRAGVATLRDFRLVSYDTSRRYGRTLIMQRAIALLLRHDRSFNCH